MEREETKKQKQQEKAQKKITNQQDRQEKKRRREMEMSLQKEKKLLARRAKQRAKLHGKTKETGQDLKDYPKCGVCDTNIALDTIYCVLCKEAYHKYCTHLNEYDNALVCYKCQML